jgi:hypothetical protein
MTVNMEAYEDQLALDQGILLGKLARLGFSQMSYPFHLWPPCTMDNLYVCTTPMLPGPNGLTYPMIPLMIGRSLSMYKPWVEDRVAYHLAHVGRVPYGKKT